MYVDVDESDKEFRGCYQERPINLRDGRGRVENRGPLGIRMDFPKFAGDDVPNWVDKVEQYFDLYNTSNEDRVQLASYYLTVKHEVGGAGLHR